MEPLIATQLQCSAGRNSADTFRYKSAVFSQSAECFCAVEGSDYYLSLDLWVIGKSIFVTVCFQAGYIYSCMFMFVVLCNLCVFAVKFVRYVKPLLHIIQ